VGLLGSAGAALVSVLFALFGIPFLVGGIVMAVMGLSRARRTIRALTWGRWAPGTISDVYHDTSVEINGRSPWALVYAFDVAGQEYSGTARTWDRSTSEREPGQPIHVLYLSEDPDQSTVFPPVK
jgi:hypothetical protein